MLDSRGRRVAVNVGLAVVLISLGSVLLLRKETTGNRSSAGHMLMDGRFAPQQLATQIKTCSTGRTTDGNPVMGICSGILASAGTGTPNVNTCCGQADPVVLPDFSGCSSQCITRAAALWCTLGCRANSVWCQSSVESLLGNCTGCAVFNQNGLTAIQWAQQSGINTGVCNANNDFLVYAPMAETAPPTITQNTLTQPAASVISGTLQVTSVLAPITSLVQLSSAATSLVIATASYATSSWQSMPNNVWQLSYAFTFQSNDPAVTTSGTLNFYASVTNTNGTTTTTVTASNPNIAVTITPNQWVRTNPAWSLRCAVGTPVVAGCAGSVFEVGSTGTMPTSITTGNAQSTLIKGTGSSTTLLTPATVSLAALAGCNTLSSLSLTTPGLANINGAYICLDDAVLTLTGPTTQTTPKISATGNSRLQVQGSALTIAGAPAVIAAPLAVQAGGSLLITGEASVASPITLVPGGLNLQGAPSKLSCNAPSSTAVCINLQGGSVSGSAQSTINVFQGTIIETPTDPTNTPAIGVTTLNIGGSATAAKIQRLDTTTSSVSGSVVVGASNGVCKGITFGSGGQAIAVTVKSRGALFISASCDTGLATTGTVQVKIAASVTGTLTVDGGKLVFTDVTQQGSILHVTSPVTFSNGGSIEVQLSQTNVPATNYDIYLMRWSVGAATSCEIGTTITVTNPSPNRPPVQSCKVFDTFAYVTLSVPNATNPTPPAPVVPTQFSTQFYYITLGKECNTFSQTDFINAATANTGLPASFILVDSFTCGSVIAKFHCGDTTSQQQADANCQNIVNSANSGALRSIYNTQSTRTEPRVTGDASNSGLWALFVLVLVPICCIFCIVLVVRNKNRRADNQYKQDTATFANVASSPQPINYPYPYPGATQTQPQPPYGYPDVTKAYELPPAEFAAPVPQQAPYPY